MVALLAIMAQMGSYVPASSVMMSPLDAVLTRMGGKRIITLYDLNISSYIVYGSVSIR